MNIAVSLPLTFRVCRQMRRGILSCVRTRADVHVDLIDGRRSATVDLTKYDGFIGHPDELVSRADIPMVVCDPDTGWESSYVRTKMKGQGVLTCETEAVGGLAADFLVEEGFVHFAYVDEVGSPAWSVRRWRAFHARLHEHGFDCALYDCTRGEQGGPDNRRLERFLKKLPRPTAVLAAHDGRAREVFDAAQSAGLLVPRDIAVMGVDNDEDLCEAMCPSLTSIELDAESAAEEATRRLIQSILVPQPVGRIVFGPKRIVRRASNRLLLASDDPIVSNALNYIVTHATQAIDVDHVVRACGTSRRLLERHFADSLSTSVGALITEERLKRVRMLLEDSPYRIEKIARMCGYGSSAYLARVFLRHFGMTMQTYRNRSRP